MNVRLAEIAFDAGTQIRAAIDQQVVADYTSPKHLRVGINAAMCDHGALVRLLVEKGIIAEADYLQAITDETRREVERYRAWFRERGITVDFA